MDVLNSTLCTTGIAGLNQILAGGLPRHRLYRVQGDPGVGKTTSALQFLLAGARAGEKGLYIMLSETREKLMAVTEIHDCDLLGGSDTMLKVSRQEIQG